MKYSDIGIVLMVVLMLVFFISFSVYLTIRQYSLNCIVSFWLITSILVILAFVLIIIKYYTQSTSLIALKHIIN